MIEGYFLNGVDGEQMLVFRSGDPEEILRIITRLGASRDKEIKGLANKLELLWYEREHLKKNDTTKGFSSNTRPKGRKSSNDRPAGGN